MDIPDATLGKVILVSTAGLFLVLVVWVNSYALLDKESALSQHLPAPAGLLAACAGAGLGLVAALMAFTLYHIYPHLHLHN